MRRRQLARVAAFGLTAAALALVTVDGPVGAASLTVNSTVDSTDAVPGDGVCADATGACSLRAAVTEANALPGDDTIALPGGSFVLTTPGDDDTNTGGDVDVAPVDGASLTISGAGVGVTAIDGNGASRVLHVLSGRLTLSGVTVRNGAAPTGAGLQADPGGQLNLRDVEVRDNTSGDSAVRSDGVATFTRVTIAGTAGGGAGLHGAAGSLSLTNSTVSTNTGSGVRTTGATIGLTHVTITGNAGGVAAPAGQVTLQASIVGGNGGTQCTGAVASQGFNVTGDATCAPATTDRPGADTGLGPLAANGGGTPTHAPGAGSPAVDLVADGVCAVADDQRGQSRPVDGDGDGTSRCDAGAVEIRALPRATPTTVPARAGERAPASPVRRRPTFVG